MTALFDDVVQVPGQLPLPKMPSEKALFQLRPVRRPNGRSYRPRKAPGVLLLGEDEIAAVAVMRTIDVRQAERLALQALAGYAPDASWVLAEAEVRWGSWRPDRDVDGSVWVNDVDGSSGTPAVFFEVQP